MFDMFDVIQMTKISRHYLLEYQTLLDSYEMQEPNVTNTFRVLDFSDDISDIDYTSDNWSVNESYSETSGEATNSDQRNLLANRPEYSVCAGSKPLSIIIKRCNTPSTVCSSPLQEVNKENSSTNTSSAPSVHCNLTDLLICQRDCAYENRKPEKHTKCSTTELKDQVDLSASGSAIFDGNVVDYESEEPVKPKKLSITESNVSAIGSALFEGNVGDDANQEPNKVMKWSISEPRNQVDIAATGSAIFVGNEVDYESKVPDKPLKLSITESREHVNVSEIGGVLFDGNVVDYKNKEPDKLTKWSISEPRDQVDVSASGSAVFDGNVVDSPKILCQFTEKHIQDVSHERDSLVKEEHLENFLSPNVDRPVSVVDYLPLFKLESTEKINNLFPSSENNMKSSYDNFQEDVGKLKHSGSNEDLVCLDHISYSTVGVNISNVDDAYIPKVVCTKGGEIPEYDSVYDNQSLNLQGNNSQFIKDNYFSGFQCYDKSGLAPNDSQDVKKCVMDQSTLCLSKELDFDDPFENVDRLRHLSCSPLLFSSDDESSSIAEEVNKGIKAALAPSPQYTVILTCEKKKVGKLQELLMGAPPPPSVTMPLHSASEMLNVLKNCEFWELEETRERSSYNLDNWNRDAATMPWPQVKCLQYPDIHYNHGTVSEQFEGLCQKLLTRCVGAETASSVTVWSSFTLPIPRKERRILSARRTSTGAPTGISPGRRLSHLARRHRTFSSASLLNDSKRLQSALPHVAPERRTILVESRKKDSKKSRSSQKKKNDHDEKTRDVHAMKLNSSKRALFQSPTEEDKKASLPSKFRPSSASAIRSRRSLFTSESSACESKSPNTSSWVNASISRKRTHADSEEEICENLPRRRLFCEVDTGVSTVPSNGNSRQAELSATHKKKLLWAVAEALKKQGIGLTHPQFRDCATALASTCRYHVQEVLASRQGSTSDRLLQLALRFVDGAVMQQMKKHPQTDQSSCTVVR